MEGHCEAITEYTDKSELIEQISRERIIQIRIYRYNIVPDIPSGVPGLCCFMGYDSSS